MIIKMFFAYWLIFVIGTYFVNYVFGGLSMEITLSYLRISPNDSSLLAIGVISIFFILLSVLGNWIGNKITKKSNLTKIIWVILTTGFILKLYTIFFGIGIQTF